MTITTTNGESFTDQEHAEMARLIYKRFGRDPKSATKAWQRLMENNCTEQQFMELVEKYTAPLSAFSKNMETMTIMDQKQIWVILLTQMKQYNGLKKRKLTQGHVHVDLHIHMGLVEYLISSIHLDILNPFV